INRYSSGSPTVKNAACGSRSVTFCAQRTSRRTTVAVLMTRLPPTAGRSPRDWVGALPAQAGQPAPPAPSPAAVSYTHLRAHETRHDLVCRLLLEKKKKKKQKKAMHII